MDKRAYQEALTEAKAAGKRWQSAALAAIAANVLLAVFMWTVNTQEKTILVPPDLNRAVWVHGSEVSPEYLEELARFFAGQLLNYSSSNARYQFESILKYVSPAAHGALRAEFDDQVRSIQRASVSSSFWPSRIIVDGPALTALIEGQQVTRVGTRAASDSTRTYELTFSHRGGTVTLSGFTELERLPSGKYQPVSGDAPIMLPRAEAGEGSDHE